MNETGQNKNNEALPRPARSRFNFSNNRLDSAPIAPVARPEPEAEFESESEQEQGRVRKRYPRLHHVVKSGPLIFNVAQLLRDHEGATRDYDYAQDQLHLNEPIGDEVAGTEATAIKGHVRLTRVRHDVLAQGPGEADVILNCVRCLNDFSQHVNYEVEEVFHPSIDVVTGLPVAPEAPEDQADLKIDANHLIDMGEAIRQQILVSLPWNPICGDDCPGLYEYLDRANEDVPEAEEADASIPDPRWAGLSRIKLDE